MSMPTPEELIEGINVIITWGINFVVLGLITIAIGVILLAVVWAYYDWKKPVSPLEKYR